jgi:hypothetical protein
MRIPNTGEPVTPELRLAMIRCGVGEEKERSAHLEQEGGTALEADDLAKEPDLIHHPPHYTHHPSGIECIQVTEHMNFNLGNAVKYIWRHDKKNGVEDLEKARWYIGREIHRLAPPPF